MSTSNGILGASRQNNGTVEAQLSNYWWRSVCKILLALFVLFSIMSVTIIAPVTTHALLSPAPVQQQSEQATSANALPGSSEITTTTVITHVLYLPLVMAGSIPRGGQGPFSGRGLGPFKFDGDLRTLPPAPFIGKRKFELPPPAPLLKGGTQGEAKDPISQALQGQVSAPAAIQSFDGISAYCCDPPDTNGVAGPNHYVQAINVAYAIYDKAGTQLVTPTNFTSLFGAPPATNTLCDGGFTSDPVVLYDALADRWVFTILASGLDITDPEHPVPIPPFYECVAVSQTANPVTGGWFKYALIAHPTQLNDYPKLGVWPDAYYMSANMNGCCGGLVRVYALDRNSILAGGPLNEVHFDIPSGFGSLLPSNLHSTPPPAGAPNVFAAVDFYNNNVLNLWNFHVDWGTPTNSTFGVGGGHTPDHVVTVAAYTHPSAAIPQPGTTTVFLDVLGDRAMAQAQYRRIGGTESLWVNHTVNAGGGVVGVRWYEVHDPAGSPTIFQQGTFNNGGDGINRWMASLAVDHFGNMAVGYNVSNSTVNPGIRYAGRLESDPLGTLNQGETTLFAGTGNQINCIPDTKNGETTCTTRWGDYSGMSVDPVDDCTFWFTGEYGTGSGYRTRITSFRFPACSKPPVANANGPYETIEGTDKILIGSASDPNGDPLTYEWDFNYDGTFNVDATGPTPTFDLVGQDGVFPVALRVTDPEGLSDIDETTVTVDNVAPSVNLNSNAPQDEGATVTVNGVVSDPGWLDPLSATIDWTDGSPVETITGVLENTRPDATLTFAISHVYGDNGMYNVEVCAADDDTTDNCETIVVQIDNVSPTVTIDPGQVTEIDEGDFVDVLANFSDPGWLDTYTSLIDWGTPAGDTNVGNLIVTIEGPPLDQGQVTGSHQYGDNGLFPVTVTVTDDDGGVGSNLFGLTVNNINPTAKIDESGTVLINGIPTFMAHTGEPLDFSGRSTDPGSDDLFLSWDWDDGPPSPDVTTTYLVNPPNPDPFPSPSVQPRDITDEQTRAFTDACLYEISFLADDDDGGHGEDQAIVVITGNADKARSEGYWQHQYSDNGNIDFDQETLECYLAIVDFMSTVFNQERDASTIQKAHDVLFLKQNQGSETEQFDRELLTVWLNFANGALEFSDITKVVSKAESVRLNSNAADKEIREETRILHQLNN